MYGTLCSNIHIYIYIYIYIYIKTSYGYYTHCIYISVCIFYNNVPNDMYIIYTVYIYNKIRHYIYYSMYK